MKSDHEIIPSKILCLVGSSTLISHSACWGAPLRVKFGATHPKPSTDPKYPTNNNLAQYFNIVAPTTKTSWDDDL